jgi:hypothetical protein
MIFGTPISLSMLIPALRANLYSIRTPFLFQPLNGTTV